MRAIPWLLGLVALTALFGCGDDDPPTGGVDVTPPEVTLIAPADSVIIVVPRSIEFRARATDNIGVRVVLFYFDGERVGQDVEGTDDVYSFLWPTEPLSVGAHRAIVNAYDWASLMAADTATVIVQ